MQVICVMKLPLSLAASLIVLSGRPAPAAVWTAGHGDLEISYSAGPIPAFNAIWKIGTGGDAGTVDNADVYDSPWLLTTLTPRAGLLPIASPDPVRTGGTPLYLLPQDGVDASTVGAPFQGWTVSGIPSGLFTNNRLSLSLAGVTGPGQVSLWSDGAFGDADFLWTSADGFSNADTLLLGTGGHSHFNLAFTQPGDYQLTVLIQGTLTAGGSVTTPVTLNYQVIPEPGSLALLGCLAMLAGRRRH